VREIGDALGVSHVLEGSVRRAGDRVAVNVALIDTQDERQVWAEHYERSLTDTLSLQGELALEIARALRTTLSPAEQTLAAAKPTENPDAYLAYLRGREIELAAGAATRWLDVIDQYRRAIDLDPTFALAHARLSMCANQQFYERADTAWQTEARARAEEALRLRPNLGEAHLALAYCQLYIEKDLPRAIAALARAGELLPNSAEVPLARAFIYKRQGRFRDRIAELQRAEALDPRNIRVLSFVLLTNRWVRDWPEAVRALDRLDVLLPTERADRRRWGRATVDFQLNGNLDALKRVLAEYDNAEPSRLPEWVNAARYEVAMLERDYGGAERLLTQVTQKGLDEANLPTVETHLKSFHEALLSVASGTDAAARQQSLERARAELQAQVEAGGASTIDYSTQTSDLAIIHALLGRKEEAIANASHPLHHPQLPPGIERNYHASALALVYTRTGEPDKAIDLIEQLLTQPVDLHRGAVFNMTLTDLRWRWVWDPLRSHPRFQKLLAGPEPKTIY
jgi:tetratricopeptide (TPR) repeat protein